VNFGINGIILPENVWTKRDQCIWHSGCSGLFSGINAALFSS
jgi:hypothetical protein